MKIILAIISALMAQMMLIGVERVAGIEIDLLARTLIAVPLTLIIEFPMLIAFGGGHQ